MVQSHILLFFLEVDMYAYENRVARLADHQLTENATGSLSSLFLNYF
jgi:hypothetical protein